ncbi:MAG: hypothetical protein MPI95_05795 [Nitrosopumilus sp.]|nr:hypothetical protein [Nitrosopumilus sp.]MDA7958582.1 hypothetical protein [Nitrosopumilus sp.]MDA7959729.1 hypothetical protein [Nitrosopumilus sp.]
MEQFSWLLRITQCLTEILPGCAVRGGIGVMLNMPGDRPRRLSMDTDVDTNAARHLV